MTPESLAECLVPIAAELIGSVRDYGPETVADVLARVPDGRHDALAVILAAMVDPDARPTQLLAWTRLGPVRSREFAPPAFRVQEITAEALGRRAERRAEVARLSGLGLTVGQIAERLNVTKRTVVRHRSALRKVMPGVAA